MRAKEIMKDVIGAANRAAGTVRSMVKRKPKEGKFDNYELNAMGDYEGDAGRLKKPNT